MKIVHFTKHKISALIKKRTRYFWEEKCTALRHTPFESAWFGLSKKAKTKKIHRGLFEKKQKIIFYVVTWAAV